MYFELNLYVFKYTDGYLCNKKELYIGKRNASCRMHASRQ